MGRGARAANLDVATYLAWTRDVAVSCVLILPLLVAYEIGVLRADIGYRNSAELVWKGLFQGVSPWVHHLLLLAIAAVAWETTRRRIPTYRLLPVLLLESLLLALLLGPVVGAMVNGWGLKPAAPTTGTTEFLLSLGAGIYEELFFRLLLLAGLHGVLCRALGIDWRMSVASAVLVSATAFSVYHHLGPLGDPWSWGALGFRFVAGIVLGCLFVVRGLAVCVYLHAFYDIFQDLKAAELLP